MIRKIQTFLLFVVMCAASGILPWKSIHSASDFKEFVVRSGFSTDKTTLHTYETMYWNVLNRILLHTTMPPRIFEIGLGCYMPHGPGGSAKVWRAMFKMADIHVFEYQRECGEEWEHENPDIAVLHYGDQSNTADLLEAVRDVPAFDMMVDDGSHISEHQLISLRALWASVKPGGAYVVEDVHSSCHNWGVPGTKFSTGGSGNCMTDSQGKQTFFAHVLQEWLPVLARSSYSSPPDLPELESIIFYHEAIVFMKKAKY